MIYISTLKEQEVFPGARVRLVHSKNMTLGYWNIAKGTVIPEHSHPQEQIMQVSKGKFELTIEGSTHIYENGSLAIIPPNAIHNGRAITECKILDIFSPSREDLLKMTEKQESNTLAQQDSH